MYHPVDVHDSVQEIFLDAQTVLMDRAWAWAARRAEELREDHRVIVRRTQAKSAKKKRAKVKARERWAWSLDRGWYVK